MKHARLPNRRRFLKGSAALAGSAAAASVFRLPNILRARAPGDKVTLTLRRDGTTQTVTVTLGVRPS